MPSARKLDLPAGQIHVWWDLVGKRSSRQVMETVLARYLDPPFALRRHAKGKPFLDGSPLSLSLSHHGQGIVVAVAWEKEVGVDLVDTGQTADLGAIARRFFQLHERQWLNALPSTQQTQGFWMLWTAKEAWLKSEGVGLAGLPLSDVPAILHGGRWQVGWFIPSVGFLGALVGPAEARVSFHSSGAGKVHDDLIVPRVDWLGVTCWRLMPTMKQEWLA